MTTALAHGTDYADDVAEKSLWQRWPILLSILITLCYIVATHDMEARERWNSFSKSNIENLTERVEEGRAARQIGFLALGAIGAFLCLKPSAKTLRPDWRLLFPAVVFLSWILISPLWSTERDLTIKRLIIFICTCLCVGGFLKHYRLRDVACLMFVGTGLIAAIAIVYELYAGAVQGKHDVYRFCGTLHPNHQGINSAMLLISSLYFWDRTKLKRFALIAATALVLLVLTKSRTALIGGVAAAVLFFALRNPIQRTIIIGAIVGGVGAIFVWLGTMGVLPSALNLLEMGREDSDVTTLTGRDVIWGSAWSLMAKDEARLFTGFAYQSFWTGERVKYVSNRVFFHISEGHNAYFDTLLETGLVGLLCWLVLLFGSLLKWGYGAYVHQNAAYALAAAMLIFAVIHGFTESSELRQPVHLHDGRRRHDHAGEAAQSNRSDRMKVLIVTADFPPFISGVGDYTDRLAAALQQQGADVTVLTSSGDDDGVRRSYKLSRTMPSFKWGYRKRLLDLAAEQDVINIQYPGVHYGRSPMVNLFPHLLRRRAPHVRTTVTIHDFRVMRTRWRARTWPMLQGVHGILHVDPGDWPVISRWLTLRKPASACVPIASNVEVLPFGADDRARWRRELTIEDGETACAYFGIIYPHKGLDELLDATQRLRGKGHKLKTVVVGDFDRVADWRGPIEKRLLNDPGVVWARGASLERVSQCLHACDIAALPFHSGTSVNRSSMLATIGHGLPTVTTRGDVTPKQITDLFDLILVPPKDTDQLTAGIESLLTDAALRSRMQANMKVQAATVTWDTVAKKHIEFFHQLQSPPK
jgi:glycosyltransferase involved in cell wall biosynthesis/O-antigen ligase